MEITLPRVYNGFVSEAIMNLKYGVKSKQDFWTIEEQASELSPEEQYEFLKRIRDGLIASSTEHAKVCQNPAYCEESIGSEQSINSLNKRMDALAPKVKPQLLQPAIDETVSHPIEHSAARQVLAMRFLLEYAKIKVNNDRAGQRLMHFFTGKSPDNLYKLWRNPYNKDLFTAEVEDLRFVRNIFEDLGAMEIVKMISNEIDNPNR
ncbi:hypothetical protein [Spirosoma panaciterrae]|uniref:hypothetical protein n=1 Tax=Spirosoma panaciterrae TaxID=496058 RepID=UPI0012FAFC50|nr:hypothetical protein [Spirosoma panaciterrae]